MTGMLVQIKSSDSAAQGLRRASLLRGKPNVSVHTISIPTPVLLHGAAPVTPNRTNYFPTPQLMLATSAAARLEMEGIPWTVHFNDYKSVPDMDAWDADLRPYGEFQYGPDRLTKCYVGDGLERLSQEL